MVDVVYKGAAPQGVYLSVTDRRGRSHLSHTTWLGFTSCGREYGRLGTDALTIEEHDTPPEVSCRQCMNDLWKEAT